MSILSWNCRGLGHPRTVQVLTELVKHKRPSVVFLMETLSYRNQLEYLRSKLGFENLFVVDRVGRRGGLALFWDVKTEARLIKCAKNFIDIEIGGAGSGHWRMTGYYGYPESTRRRDSWNLLRYLATISSLPWVCLGDFNDLLSNSEKRGRRAQPNWKLNGFREAVADAGLVDLGMEGYQFTWERARGTS